MRHAILGSIIAAACTATHAQPWEGSKGTEAWVANTHNGIQLVNIECAETFVDPPQIVVRANVPVHFKVRGRTDTLQFVNQAFVAANLPIGKVPTLQVFVPTVAGQYELSCQPRSGTPGPVRTGILVVQ